MRRVPWLILAVIIAVISTVFSVYRTQKAIQTSSASAPAQNLPAGVSAQYDRWEWTKTINSDTVAHVSAKSGEQLAQGTRFRLNGVNVQLFHKDKNTYDQVRCATADLDQMSGILFSEGSVEITRGVPESEKQQPTGKLLTIKASGVRYDVKTGKMSTDRPASFTFDRGDGKATGADYNPEGRELKLHSGVVLHWRGSTTAEKPMDIEAGTLLYKEKDAKVYLGPWSKLQKGTLHMEAGDAIVTLNKGGIQLVEAEKAHGLDQDPKRMLDYAAGHLRIDFDGTGAVKAVDGAPDAKVISTSGTAETTITTNHLQMDFDTTTSESLLTQALATGHSVVESKPVPRPKMQLQETRMLRSEVILLKMKPDGSEILNVETRTPGTAEFLPNAAGQRHRLLTGDHLWMDYGDQNILQSFRAVGVTTRTDALPVQGKPLPPPALTWSKELQAAFDPKSGQLTRMEQRTDFRYEDGARRAKSDAAVLEYAKNVITLSGPNSRVWDPTGSTAADQIVINQKSGDLAADGNVASTRLPDKKPTINKPPVGKEDKATPSATGLLSGDEPLQARAAHMKATDGNLQIEYEGSAVLWQGPNRLQADRVRIDRDASILVAHGKVVSQVLDKADRGSEPASVPAKTKANVFTIVKAPDLVYEDTERVAHYTGGVLLNRPGLAIQSAALTAFLKNTDQDSSLDKAFADGAVKIVQTSPDRVRTGTSEHAEYYDDDGKVILQKGDPALVDSLRGTTHGRQLTYFLPNDRLIVDGVDARPAVSNLRRKK